MIRLTPFALAGAACALSLLAPTPARAQSTASRPFPSPAGYPYGYIPSAVTASVVQSSYDHWKSTYVKSSCGSGYLFVDSNSPAGVAYSEGMGYGMVLSAYFGDETTFQGLWKFIQKNLNSNQLMGWEVTCSGFDQTDNGGGGDSSATDGDTDIAFGLVVASVQWGGPYTAAASSYLAAMKKNDFATCNPSGRILATAGDWQPASMDVCTSNAGSNTSYWAPAYYHVFEQMTGDSFWGTAATGIESLYPLAANSKTGLIAVTVDQTGALVGSGANDTVEYNACRDPWREALDYVWYGTPGVKQTLTTLTGWVNSVGISKIVDGYEANGTPDGQYTGMNPFVGAFADGAMADSQSMVDAFATYFVSIDNDNGAYFGSSLRTLYLLELGGFEWNPADLDGGTLGPGSSSSSGAGGSSSSGGSGSGSGGSSSGASHGGGSDAGSGSDAGTKGGTGDAGSKAGGYDAGVPPRGGPGLDGGGRTDDGSTGDMFFPDDSSSGGCRMVGSRGWSGGALAALLSLAVLRRGRRRSRAQG
jgi:endo-1,4-beta-D-glucanase Y